MDARHRGDLTQAGAVMGTATYFSPEQAQGAQPDPRSDLYSLGIVMYEMVAGRPPFDGDNPVSIAYKQVHDYPHAAQPDRARRAAGRTRRSSPSCSPRTRRSATPSADALREDLRRFRNGERPVALESAAATARASGAVTTAVVNPSQQRTAVQRKAGGGPGRPTRTGRAGPGPGRPPGGRGARRAIATTARRVPAGTHSPPSSPSSRSASAGSCCSTPSPTTTTRATPAPSTTTSARSCRW